MSSSSGSSPVSTIVVGVIPDQPATVLVKAAELAGQLGARIVCAHVDPTRITLRRLEDGTVLASPLDPDQPEETVLEIDPHFRQQVAQVLDPLPVPWSIRPLAGSASTELALLAEETDALMIIVGTREAGIRHAFREFFTGSVAVQLAHRQHRPVLMVPLQPTGLEQPLPWQLDEAEG
jgi:nucleotide-binding universal stress UspA family protein